jgi:hypothetical protein
MRQTIGRKSWAVVEHRDTNRVVAFDAVDDSDDTVRTRKL